MPRLRLRGERIFDPIANKWIAENEGIAPDLEEKIDALSVSKGRDMQL